MTKQADLLDVSSGAARILVPRGTNFTCELTYLSPHVRTQGRVSPAALDVSFSHKMLITEMGFRYDRLSDIVNSIRKSTFRQQEDEVDVRLKLRFSNRKDGTLFEIYVNEYYDHGYYNGVYFTVSGPFADWLKTTADRCFEW